MLKTFKGNYSSWDDFFSNEYPRLKKNLWDGTTAVSLSFPAAVKDEAKEQEFKEMLTKDTKRVIEELSNMEKSIWGKFRIYGRSIIKEGPRAFRMNHMGTLLLPAFLYTVHPLLGILAPALYGGAIECGSYRESKKLNEKVIGNLEKLPDNISVHYIVETKKL